MANDPTLSPAPDIDQTALQLYLETKIPGFGHLESIGKFPTGQSNPTYLLTTDKNTFVMRAKPPGQLLKSAHQVDREFRVMAALEGTGVPVPKMHFLSGEPQDNDDNPLGRQFFVMERVAGVIHWDPALPGSDIGSRADIYDATCRALATLHDVEPDKVGLRDFGAPGNYFARQVNRWSRQYRTSEVEPRPDVDRLIDWLAERIPDRESDTRIVHGDFRIDNLIFDKTKPRLLAVLDWELSTLGDPMADISYQAMQLRLPNQGRFRGLGGLDRAEMGIPSEREYLERYCELRGIPMPRHWDFYLAFNYFRLIAILDGVLRRAIEGNASNPTGSADFPIAIRLLAEQASEIIRNG